LDKRSYSQELIGDWDSLHFSLYAYYYLNLNNYNYKFLFISGKYSNKDPRPHETWLSIANMTMCLNQVAAA
jgi:hypothetical protein